MTQLQYDMIVKVIQNGAPALAEELISALGALITSYQELKAEREQEKPENKEED